MEKSDIAIQGLLELKEWFPKSMMDESIPILYENFLSEYKEISTTRHSENIEFAEKMIIIKPLREKVPKSSINLDRKLFFDLLWYRYPVDLCSSVVEKTLKFLPDQNTDYNALHAFFQISLIIYTPSKTDIRFSLYEIMPYLKQIPSVDLLAFLQKMKLSSNDDEFLLAFSEISSQLDKEHLIELLKSEYKYGLSLLHNPELYRIAIPLIENHDIDISTITAPFKYPIDSPIYLLLNPIPEEKKEFICTLLENTSSEECYHFFSLISSLNQQEKWHIITYMQANPQFSLSGFLNNAETTLDHYSTVLKMICVINGITISKDRIDRITAFHNNTYYNLLDWGLDSDQIKRYLELISCSAVDDTRLESYHDLIKRLISTFLYISPEMILNYRSLIDQLSNNELLFALRNKYPQLSQHQFTNEECLYLIEEGNLTNYEAKMVDDILSSTPNWRTKHISLKNVILITKIIYLEDDFRNFKEVLNADFPLDTLCSFLEETDKSSNYLLVHELISTENPTEVLSRAAAKRGSITDPYHSSLILYFELYPHNNSSDLISKALEAKKNGIEFGYNIILQDFIKKCEVYALFKPLMEKLDIVMEKLDIDEREEFFNSLVFLDTPEQIINRLIELSTDKTLNDNVVKTCFQVLRIINSNNFIRIANDPINYYRSALEVLSPAELILLFNKKTPTGLTLLQTGDNFAKAIQLKIINRLNKDQLMTVLTAPGTQGKTLLNDPENLQIARPLMKKKGIHRNDFPKDEYGLTLFDYSSTLADSWLSEPKLDPRLMNPVQNYERRALAVKNKLLKAWDEIPFDRMPEATKNLLLEVNNNVRTKEAVRESLVSMLEKLQMRTVWLGTPDADHPEELNAFYDEQLICFEEVAKSLAKANNPEYTTALLVSIASPDIEGRCGTAYIDELNQKVEIINPELAPKNLSDRFKRCANKALLAITQELVSELHENNVHASRQYKYVCGQATSPDDLWDSVEETKLELLDNFSLISFLDNLNFPDELCDLYLEEYVIWDDFGKNLIQLANSCLAEENRIKTDLPLPKPQLDKISSMKTTLKFLYKENFRDASKKNLIERAFELTEKALPGVNIHGMIAKPLDQFTNQDVQELRETLTDLVNSRARNYIRNNEPAKYRAETAILSDLLNALDGILIFDREMAPLNLNKSDRVAAFKARLSLEQAYLKMGKTLQEQHDISFDLKSHGSPSEAVKKARLTQFIMETIDPECTYYKKLLYIAQNEGMLTAY